MMSKDERSTVIIRKTPILKNILTAIGISSQNTLHQARGGKIIGYRGSAKIWIESFQDFLIKLDMHLVEISIFALNDVTVRLTKIMNNFLEHFKSFFSV